MKNGRCVFKEEHVCLQDFFFNFSGEILIRRHYCRFFFLLACTPLRNNTIWDEDLRDSAYKRG